MKTRSTILALSFAAAWAASTVLAQQTGFVSYQGAGSEIPPPTDYFQDAPPEVAPEPAPLAGDYFHPGAPGECYDRSCYRDCCNTGCSNTGCCNTGRSPCDCSPCGCNCRCDSPFFHRNRIWGEYLYMMVRDAEVVFAAPGTGPVQQGGQLAAAVPQGSALILDPDKTPAYRVGVAKRVDERSSFEASYWSMQNTTQNGVQLDANQIAMNQVVFPLLLHPLSALPNNVNNVAAQGAMDVDFDIIDVAGRSLLWYNETAALNGFTGVRWAHMDQDVVAAYTINNGTIVAAGSQYDGLGFRAGFDGEYRSQSGLGFYGKGAASLMYGTAKGYFTQFQANNFANPQAFTDGRYDKLSPILDLEFGFQWVSRQDRLRLAAGYVSSIWFNVITANDFIDGVHQGQVDDISDTMTFDGYMARAEARF